MSKFKNLKLKRDRVITIMPYGERVGVYFEDSSNTLVAEMSPTKADKIINLWNTKE